MPVTRRQPYGMEEFNTANYDPTYTAPVTKGAFSGAGGYQAFDITGGEPGPIDNPGGTNTGVSGYGPGGEPVPPIDAPKYAPIQGFDFEKLSGAKPYDSAEKYSDSVRAFSQYLGGGGKVARNDLGGLTEWLQANGFGNARAVGDDKVDFGDGRGPIDIITSSGDVWFQNGPDRFEDSGGGQDPWSMFGGSGGFPGAGMGMSGASGGGASSSGPAPSKSPYDIKAELAKLFPDGLFNKDVVSRRSQNAADELGRFRKSRVASNQAQLAERGLIGSGPEASMYNKVDTDIADLFGNAVSGIYADESENADQRMMQALGLASGLEQSEAQNAIDWFQAQSDDRLGQGQLGLGWGNLGLGHRRAGIDEMLGKGNLALGNMNAVNDYNLSLGRLGLDRDLGMAGLDNSSIDQYIQLLQLLMQGAGQSAGGYV
jgi:hypothetical protein